MSRYTLEIRHLVESSNNYKLFDFDYELYEDELKPSFEDKFISYFYFREIGQETLERFKFELKTKLKIIMPYYKELYLTQIEATKIDFLLNKDLKETFIRELNNKNDNFINSASETNTNNTNDYSSKFFDTPKNDITDINKFLTNVTNDNTKNNSTMENSTENLVRGSNEMKEKTELISQGNIGTTSSAELLTKWRETILNIDLMIFEECEELFFLLF